jgi:hypothetical protein
MKLFTEQDLKTFVSLIDNEADEGSPFDQIIRPAIYANHIGCAATEKNIEGCIESRVGNVRDGVAAYISGEDYRSEYDTYALFQTSPHYKLWLNSADFRSEVCAYLIPILEKMRDEYERAE